MKFLEVFGEIPDPRDFTSVHKLPEILFVTFAAMLCGAVHCTEFAVFGKARLELLRQFVPLEDGIPSHDTFGRVLAALDPAATEAACPQAGGARRQKPAARLCQGLRPHAASGGDGVRLRYIHEPCPDGGASGWRDRSGDRGDQPANEGQVNQSNMTASGSQHRTRCRLDRFLPPTSNSPAALPLSVRWQTHICRRPPLTPGLSDAGSASAGRHRTRVQPIRRRI